MHIYIWNYLAKSGPYLPADWTLDAINVRAVDATGTESVEAREQAGLVVVIVTDAAGERIPGSTSRHARCAVIANPVDRRARACHRPRRRQRSS